MQRKGIVVVLAMAVLAAGVSAWAQDVTKYVRYDHEGAVSYGILEGETIHQLAGDVFASPERTGATVALGDVALLAPTDPRKVVAAGLNYRSHLGGAEPAEYPGLFDKHATSLIGHGAEITYYEDASNLHFEGEMVLIIGKTARNVSVEDAPDHIFAVAAGNDISERVWQGGDLQWFRAKGADTFGPVGPVMARGVDYDDLLLQTRVNGETLQSQRTSDLLFDSSFLVSYISRYVTLEPGDMVFTGTPGTTSAMEPGDVVEIELEHVGVLRNTIGPKGGRTTNDNQ
ncbi:MAG: fumarylacetoacetate hydrolase family protein [Acidobacteria bacterium]|nr:fumarylacetoacetate hydrolase family protein [Acidobacteriota bacterium]